MRSSHFVLAFVLVGALAPPARADDDPGSITGTLNFMLGAVSVGDRHGYLAPGGHFDVGFRVRRWRLAAELETGLWSRTVEDPAIEPRTSGSFRRFGMALRWSWKELAMAGTDLRPDVRFRGYVEAGIGREHLADPDLSITRGDVMLGLGVAPELRLGRRILFGASFGLRMLISDAPPTTLARGTCGACTTASGHDLALLYVFGFTFGR